MGNGKNEPVEFTRGDAETLVKIHDKIEQITEFIADHMIKHDTQDEEVESNTRFRKTTLKIMVWIFTSSAGLGLLAAGAKATGWFD